MNCYSAPCDLLTEVVCNACFGESSFLCLSHMEFRCSSRLARPRQKTVLSPGQIRELSLVQGLASERSERGAVIRLGVLR